jgi:hypothetical protein
MHSEKGCSHHQSWSSQRHKRSSQNSRQKTPISPHSATKASTSKNNCALPMLKIFKTKIIAKPITVKMIPNFMEDFTNEVLSKSENLSFSFLRPFKDISGFLVLVFKLRIW